MLFQTKHKKITYSEENRDIIVFQYSAFNVHEKTNHLGNLTCAVCNSAVCKGLRHKYMTYYKHIYHTHNLILNVFCNFPIDFGKFEVSLISCGL